MTNLQRLLCTGVFSILATTLPAAAQNTSGVSGADVRAGQTEIGYRLAYSLDGDTPDAFGHRLHFQHSLDDSWRLRMILLQTDRGGDLRLRSVQLEALMQFLESENHRGWDSAIRVDGTIPTEDASPGRFRIGWLNTFPMGEHWQVRADIFAARDLGDLADSNLMLEARAEATYKLPSGIRIGAQSFNTARTADLAAQRRQLGFVVKGELTERLGYETGVLFGLSRDARDADFRLFLAYAL